MKKNEWTSLEEINNLVKPYRLEQKKIQDILNFFEKYFFEFEKNHQKVKLNPWTHDILGISFQ